MIVKARAMVILAILCGVLQACTDLKPLQAASAAQGSANQALAAAQSSQSCCDTTNEKLDRMFKRSVAK